MSTEAEAPTTSSYSLAALCQVGTGGSWTKTRLHRRQAVAVLFTEIGTGYSRDRLREDSVTAIHYLDETRTPRVPNPNK